MNVRGIGAIVGAAVAAGLLIGGCGHQEPAKATTVVHTSKPAPKQAPRVFETPADIAAALNCSDSYDQSDAPLYAESQGFCDFSEGVTFTLTTYATNEARDKYLDAASELAGGIYIYGDRWSVDSDVIDRKQAAQLADAIGHDAQVR
jgi:hypothetical protein